jgi:hypothetical protein
MRDLFLSINKANLDIKISNEKKKLEKPLKQDLDAAEEVFNAKMQKGYEDAMEGRCKPIDQAFADIKRRFA